MPIPTLAAVRSAGALTFLVLAMLLAACGNGDPTPDTSPGVSEPTPAVTAVAPAAQPAERAGASPFAGVPGIVDPSNHGWPREVEGTNGVVLIASKPDRIHTTSVGLDEITLGLVPVSRLAAVGSATQNTDYSNVAELVAGLPAVERDPEAIAAVAPGLVVASPTQDADFVRALVSVEIPVVQVELVNTPEGRIQTILLLGYLYGEEERALALAAEVQQRYEALITVTGAMPEETRPVVMYSTNTSDTMRTSGNDSTAQGIIEAAGGRCGPCEAGLGRTETISFESIIAVDPDVIVIPMAGQEGVAYREMLLSAAALAEVPAIQHGAVHIVTVRLHSTLSYANVRAAEQLAAILWPKQVPDEYRDDPPDFSRPQG